MIEFKGHRTESNNEHADGQAADVYVMLDWIWSENGKIWEACIRRLS